MVQLLRRPTVAEIGLGNWQSAIPNLTFPTTDAYPVLEVRVQMHQSLYRYYYYYGPLPTWRDGRAMGCLSVLS
jgi:hypothetical protein